MRKNLIKKLAIGSFSKDNLDAKKIGKISKTLKRGDLKVYIKDLKSIQAKKTVTVTLPGTEGMKEMKDYFSKIYPNKKLVFNIDETLLTGIKIVDYDNVYELSLKGFLEQPLKGTRND